MFLVHSSIGPLDTWAKALETDKVEAPVATTSMAK